MSGIPARCLRFPSFGNEAIHLVSVILRSPLLSLRLMKRKTLVRKIENCFELKYPKEKLEILVASDGSEDNTQTIVRSYASKGVLLVELPSQQGKTAAQNAAVERATGEILVFTDATTMFQPEMMRELVKPFSDPRVGCVGAELEYRSDNGASVGKGTCSYWNYEKWIKSLESKVNSLIGVSGCLYAVRKEIYSPLEPDLISDFVIASDVFAKGFVTLYGKGIVSHEVTHQQASREFQMRVRVVVRSIHALVRKAEMLNPFKYGLFSFQLFNHKVLRYAVPEFLGGVFVLNIGLVLRTTEHPFVYGALLVGQLGLAGGALVGWIALKFGIQIPYVHIPFYLVHANVAAFWAQIRYLRGERMATWSTMR